jgi:hypothetical protein
MPTLTREALMTIVRRTIFGLAAVLALWACSERREAPTGNGDGPLFAASRDTSTGASHYTANGRTASVYWYSTGGSGYANGQLQAQEVNDVRNEMVSVSYYLYSCDAAWNCVYRYGNGTLPRGVLKGGGSQSLQLEFTSADYLSFYGYIYRCDAAWNCAYDPIVGRLPANVTWTANGLYTQRWSGNTEYQGIGYSYKSNGVSTASSASAAGSMDSWAIPPGSSGHIGTNHNVTLTFQH